MKQLQRLLFLHSRDSAWLAPILPKSETPPKVIEAVLELLKKKRYAVETDGKLAYPGL